MIEKAAVDSTMKTAQNVEKGVESMIRKAWTVIDAAAEKQSPSQYLGDVGIKAIQGKSG